MRTLLLLAAVAALTSCMESPSTTAGGGDDHGNAVTATILVVDSTGTPVAGADVVVRGFGWHPGEPIDTAGPEPTAAHLVTDAFGFCRIGSLRAGQYLVRAGDISAAGSVKLDSCSSDTLVVGLYATGAVAGSLGGVPAGTEVLAQGLDSKGSTDSAGRFSLSGIPAGSINLLARAFRGGTQIEGVAIHPRLVSELENVEVDSMAWSQRSPVVQLRSFPLPPVFQTPPDQYPGAINVVVEAPILGDGLEVSVDGEPWMSTDGHLGLGASACIRARSKRAPGLYSEISTACYTIE